MADPLADMIIRIKNAQLVRKRSVVVPYSGLKSEMLRALKDAGYVEDVVKRGRRGRHVLDVVLRYDKTGSGRIRGIMRVSRQSQRVYARARNLKPSRKSANGMFILSTSRGVLSSAAAQKAKVGGELLCEVW
jgi:small subunit ribosomal protein S8